MSYSKKKYQHAQGTGERRPLPEWLAVHLDVPPDVLTHGLRVELRGRQSLTVHGCERILDYTPTEIRLSVDGGVLAVRGARLICTSYLAGAVGIDGRVDALVFETGEETA